jgi:glycosyltransferase involved in cell wall biosynthesis
MKIVIGTSTPFHLAQLARELSALGHDVLMIGYMPKWKMKNYNIGTAKYKSIFLHLFPLSLLALQRYIPKLQMQITFFMMPLVDYFIAKNIPDCNFFIGLSGVNLRSFRVAKKKWNAITICDRGSSHVEVQNNLLKSKPPKIYINRELQNYEIADYIMLPSTFAVDSFISRGIPKKKIRMNYYGINLQRFCVKDACNYHDKMHQNTIKTIYIGGWTYRKAVDIIYDVVMKDPNLFFTHIGTKGVEMPFPVHKRMVSIGHIPNSELQKYYAENDIFIFPSRDDGFGMVILEALACGLPVIASKNTGAPDVKMNIEKNDYVILMESISKESLLKAIETFRMSNLLNQKGEILTKKDKEFFSWKAYGERYNNILNELK